VSEAAFSQALAAHRAGRLEEAERLYRRALDASPGDGWALQSLGLLARERGRLEEAVDWLERAARLPGAGAGAWNNLGGALREAGRLHSAAEAYRRALALDAEHGNALFNLGGVLRELGEANEAAECYRRLVAHSPDDADARHALGAALEAQGSLEAAEDAFASALRVRPEFAEAHNDLGRLARRRGAPETAARCFRRALALDAGFAEAHNNLGNVLEAQGRLEEAIACYRQALAVRPELALAWNNLGNALKAQARLDEAIAAFRRALALDFAPAHGNLLFALNYLDGLDRGEVLAEHRAWARRQEALLASEREPHSNEPDPDKRLRVGYVSPDFRTHSVAYFAEPLIARHDRERFEVVLYADLAGGAQVDPVTERLRASADGWRNVSGESDRALAALVRRDRIDVLVDLAGHTAGNRLPVFARKPAPVQVSYLGYPNTTGLESIDYRLTDAVADPPGASDRFYSESLVRLPRGFLCYRPPEPSPAIAAPPATREGYVTFGSFNNAAKLSPGVIEAWARILRALPSARLRVKAPQIGDEGTRRLWRERLARAGVDPGRLTLEGFVAGAAEHLDAYRRIDVALDTFPYNGTTTTCEALWMGVPVVALAGAGHASRVGLSLLSQIGLEAFAADTVEAYIERAVALARDPQGLARLRATLRDRLRASPLRDESGLARAVEAQYRWMWGRWCAGQSRP